MTNKDSHSLLMEQTNFIGRVLWSAKVLTLIMKVKFANFGMPQAIICACPDCKGTGIEGVQKQYRHGVEKDYQDCKTCKTYGVVLVYITDDAVRQSLSSFVASAEKVTPED